MRKIQLLLAIMAVSSATSFAQLEKNKWYTGFSLTRGFGNGITAYGVQPSVSFSLDKHSLLSVYGKYQKGKEMANPFSVDRSGRMTEIGAGIGYTYYRSFKKGGKFGWYLDAAASVNRISNYDLQSGKKIAVHRYMEKQLHITPGLFYRASPRVMLFANFGGLSVIGDQCTRDFGNQFNIGLRISLGKIAEKRKQ